MCRKLFRGVLRKRAAPAPWSRIVDHTADVLEGVGRDLDGLSEEIFGTNAANAWSPLAARGWRAIASRTAQGRRNGDLTSKIEDLLLGMARMVRRPISRPTYAQNSKACNATSLSSTITRR
jgi:hypothetical protein